MLVYKKTKFFVLIISAFFLGHSKAAMKEMEQYYIGFTTEQRTQMTVDNIQDVKLNKVPEILLALVVISGIATLGLR